MNGVHYCVYCGAAVTYEQFCPQCGNRVTPPAPAPQVAQGYGAAPAYNTAPAPASQFAAPKPPSRVSLGMVVVLALLVVLVGMIATLAASLPDGTGVEKTSRLVQVEGTIPDSQSPPGDVPACPDDMSALVWADYADGSYLICTDGADVRVVYLDDIRTDWVPAGVKFDDDFVTIKFSNGSAAVLFYNGGFIAHAGTEHSDTSVARHFWAAGYDEISYANAPSGMKACPESSAPLFFVAWDGGWQLTCGISANQPTLFAYSDTEFGTKDSNTVAVQPTQTGTSYCSDIDDVTVCTSVEDEQTSFTQDGDQSTRATQDSYFPQ